MPAVIAAVAARGFGANVVSRGEWALARRAGVPNERITLEGIGKTAGRPARGGAGRGGGRAAALGRARVAGGGGGAAPRRSDGRARRRVDVLYRLNPDVAPETLTGLAVGRRRRPSSG